MNKKRTFKPYNQNQPSLLPPSLDELVPKNHPVRVISRVVDSVKYDSLILEYKGGGCSAYEPRMMMKVVIYAYLSNVYSGRKIEEMLRDNVKMMWLSGQQYPDHNTITRFITTRLSNSLKTILTEVVLMLQDAGVLDIRELYVDGTKIEADANRFTFVWNKSIKTRKEKMLSQLLQILEYAGKVSEQDLSDISPTSYTEVSEEYICEAIAAINETLAGHDVDKELSRKLKRMGKEWPEQLKKYKEQEKTLNGRNSYSKTDPDATAMQMKEDHYGKSQPKPGYNVQISTNNQYIVNLDIFQTPSDTVTFKDHLEGYKKLFGTAPLSVTADAGYGSEENYEYAEGNGIEAYIKYNNFDKEKTQKWRLDISHAENLYYNAEKDCFYCPMGQPMNWIEDYESNTKTGFSQEVSRYRAINCDGCPLRGACHKAKGARTIDINRNAQRLRFKAKEALTSPVGEMKQNRRASEPEVVFANVKHNKHFRRFTFRGKGKVEVQCCLMALAHNLGKYAKHVS